MRASNFTATHACGRRLVDARSRPETTRLQDTLHNLCSLANLPDASEFANHVPRSRSNPFIESQKVNPCFKR
ncbi:hypothetical protein GLOTRDRAFT_97944 [Gloeophyllum trabeum ATCC 11539]|uniref:Uncharacterized protein n=1 Tax=Gloeophyllum trabeum (strain ATCC 11539 / FP-39264 / Madison 617) TaxID=670483 RepID=S7S0W7_GLOTA|nr:uncharacterized protein GLOTRDRAFT_97944 [Gloeophyllum trabeum ATCC 11539]EPQ61000.1 hypothetical protein GLOTRDRAFT_97944 [Gloeophyllum trabeum ATCC 11539]